jgi:hypothetical protein
MHHQRVVDRLALQCDEVIQHGQRNDGEQHHQKLALLDQIGLAGLKDDFSDVEHRLMSGQAPDLAAQIQADAQRAHDHERSAGQ